MSANLSGDRDINVDFAVRTSSAEETFNFGSRVGQLLGPGDVVALVGGLGAGKTWLAKGIALGLGVPQDEYVNSPAFNIIHEYSGRLPVYHMDFYRLENLSIEDYSWLEEYIDGEGVCIIEWADKFIDDITNQYLMLKLSIGDRQDERVIISIGVGNRYMQVIEKLRML